MSKRVLIVGRLQERIDRLVEKLREEGVEASGSADFDRVIALVEGGQVDAVAIGAGLEDAVRLPFAERLRVDFPGVEVHVKPDRTGGPGAMLPYVKGIVAAPRG